MRRVSVPLLGSLAFVLAACGSSNSKPSRGGDDVVCPDGSVNPGKTIKTVNCRTVTNFDGSDFQASLEATGIGNAGLSKADTVLRDITAAAEEMQLQFTQTCELFNSCNLTSQQFQQKLDEAQRHFRGLREKVDMLEAAKGNPEVLRQAVREVYVSTVSAETVAANTLSLEFAIQTQGADGKAAAVQQGDTLRTGTEIVFGVRTSQSAFVYVFERKASGAIDVLFPNSQIGVANPIQSGALVRIPPGGQVFKLDDQDLGNETIYIAASLQPLSDLDAALRESSTGTTQSREKVSAEMGDLFAQGNPECSGDTRGFRVTAESGCGSMTRGVNVAAGNSDSAFFQGNASVAAQTMPGDGVLLQTFTFRHED